MKIKEELTVKIAENGVFCAEIILPETPTKREKFAAELLFDYAEKMCDRKLRYAPDAKNKIIIGNPERNAAAAELISAEDFKKSVPGPEGFMILSCENTLLLAGSSGDDLERERGTLYAVYELLERFFGCSLAAYSGSDFPAGEYIAHHDELSVSDCEYKKPAADVSYRCAIVQYNNWAGDANHRLNEKFLGWLSKNRYNRMLVWWSIYEEYKQNGMLDLADKYGILFTVGHHETACMLLPQEGNKYFPEKYYRTHPEYYRLKPDGTRYYMKPGEFSGQFVFCLRNENCIKQFSENLLEWSHQNPIADTVTVWPNDGTHEQCCCRECQKHDKNDNYTYFVNETAKYLRSKGSMLKIDKLAYRDLLSCGENDTLEAGIVVDAATAQGTGIRDVGKPDGSGLNGTAYEKVLLSWINAGATGVYYDYFMGVYSKRQRYMPCADEMQAICKRFLEKNISGLGTQIECYNLWNNIFNFYTYGRTAYDVSNSMEDCLDLFCRIFGEGAPYIKEIIKICEAALDGVWIFGAAIHMMEVVNKEKVYNLFDKALDAAKLSLCKNNIRLFRMVFRYSDLEINNRKNPTVEGITYTKYSEAVDKNGELWYMRKKFDSFISGSEGVGAAFPITTENEGFEPDKYYIFDC